MTTNGLIAKVDSLPAFLQGPEDTGVYSMFREEAPATTLAVTDDARVLDAARTVLLERLAVHYLAPFAPATERNAQVVAVLRQAILEVRNAQDTTNPLYDVPLDMEVLLTIYSRTLGWGPIQKYLDDPNINEVKINGTAVMVQEAGGEFVVVPERFVTAEEVIRRAVVLATAHRVKLDESMPQVSIPAEFGTRVHVSIAPMVEKGNVLVCIRRGRTSAWNLNDVLARGTIPPELLALLQLFARAKCSFLIAGGTGSGKTALLESLVNSIPGDAHVLTIEDLTRELFLRRTDLWTRELVDTIRDPGAFSRAARESLRQTPGLLVVGESRGAEAGAILAMGMSGHAIATTIHAQNAALSVERFASYAALEGSYLYAGRHADALRDTVAAFQVVIYIEQIAGRRLVTELALPADVTTDAAGRLKPVLVPLARLVVNDTDGQLGWEVDAQPLPSGRLGWTNGATTPEVLDKKLRTAQMEQAIRSSRPAVNDLVETMARARQALEVGELDRCLNILRPVWARTRDPRLLEMARGAMRQMPGRFANDRARAQQALGALDVAINAQHWAEAQGAFDSLMVDLVLAAVAEPAGGWGPVAERISAGVMLEAEVRRACEAAQRETAAGRPWAALELVASFDVDRLGTAAALVVVTAREAAQRELLDRGEGSPDVLAALRARRAALEAALRTEQPHGRDA